MPEHTVGEGIMTGDLKTPRRRWLRFSLRTFFILLTILCVWLAVVTNSARRQRAASEWGEGKSSNRRVRLAI